MKTLSPGIAILAVLTLNTPLRAADGRRYKTEIFGVMRTSFTQSGVIFYVDGLGRRVVEPWTLRETPVQTAVGMGAGVKIGLPRRLDLRPELRAGGAVGSGYNFVSCRLCMGLGYRW